MNLFWRFFLFVSVFYSFSMVFAGELNFKVPESVRVGDPFIVSVKNSKKPRDLKIFWEEKSLQPEFRFENGLYTAKVILGASLKKRPGKYSVRVRYGKKIFKKDIFVIEREFQRQNLRVAPKLVHPPEKLKERIKKEREASLAAINTVSEERYWMMPFKRPVKGKMLSRYGLKRMFNGDTKRRHKGLDFRAWTGTPIRSIAKGKVLVTGHFYFAGKCAFIDHGNGLVSFYCHMSKLLVKKGDFIEGGSKIGLSGATGRVTGPHLHMSVYALGVNINPEPFFDGSFGES